MSDGNKITVLSTRDCPQCYYYLPFNFRLSFKNEKPEVSFISWKNDENSEIIGGIMHLITVWGINPKQEAELERKMLSRMDSTVVLMGAAGISTANNDFDVSICGGGKLTEILKKAQAGQSKAAVTPGSKMAMSFRFDESNVNDIVEAINKPNKLTVDLKVYLSYKALSKKYGQNIEESIVLTLPLKNIFKIMKE